MDTDLHAQKFQVAVERDVERQDAGFGILAGILVCCSEATLATAVSTKDKPDAVRSFRSDLRRAVKTLTTLFGAVEEPSLALVNETMFAGRKFLNAIAGAVVRAKEAGRLQEVIGLLESGADAKSVRALTVVEVSAAEKMEDLKTLQESIIRRAAALNCLPLIVAAYESTMREIAARKPAETPAVPATVAA